MKMLNVVCSIHGPKQCATGSCSTRGSRKAAWSYERLIWLQRLASAARDDDEVSDFKRIAVKLTTLLSLSHAIFTISLSLVDEERTFIVHGPSFREVRMKPCKRIVE